MRKLMLAAALLVVLVIGAAICIDEGEVVVLRTADVHGENSFFETELWIAEYQGALYVRGASHRPWMERIRAHPQVQLERNGERRAYRATLISDPQVTAGVNRAMAEKHGLADWLAGAVIDRNPQIAVRLDPVLVSGSSPE